MKYQIIIKYKTGPIARLAVNVRTAWGLRTARGHLKDVVIEKLKTDKWADVWHFTLVLA